MKGSREDEKALKAVRKAFQNAPAPRRKMTTAEIVAELYEDIKEMRDKGYPWEQIAELMGETIGLKPSTLRRYFGEAKKGTSVEEKVAPQPAPEPEPAPAPPSELEAAQEPEDNPNVQRVNIYDAS